jgi:hypothetical protein
MFGRWLLFLSSYSPLFALTALRLEPGRYRDALWAAAAVGFLSLLAALAIAQRRISPRQRVLTSVSDRGGDVAGYLATYLLPFLTVTAPTGRDALAYGLFVVLVGIVYTRSSLVSVNPVLYLLGYRLVEAGTQSGDVLLLLCRSEPPVGMPLSVRELLPGLAVTA